MGGLGSGRRWHHGAKDTTDDYLAIDVRAWQREGLLTSGRVFMRQWTCNGEVTASIRVRVETDRLWLMYRHRSGSGEFKDENYPVRLDWTACPLGGQRPWFGCPAPGCNRRVAILYGGGIFACRYCYRLAYRSQREKTDERALRRADRIRARLGWVAGVGNGGGTKPKGMHWRTFMRLFAEHNTSADQWLGGMALRFGIKR